ncbi:uncharacterized protein PADG_03536 [Paracoccidioides brasiliensis Pb18]|uniref:Protein BFR2 n=1 Tax=Paracoccidioides brasiliensis (strain Pb18) TaxID=502780 RepID=C1G8F0_PARBD|nr:uncharacterized protein PADG_03536 [Paracoccidioides brasiliensis Pb18]EEH47452.1 hypothetical protein PADG_03536 [Paracoccidioides brasiliensis Pb18]
MLKKHGQVKSLAEQIAELENPTSRDFDPEDLNDDGESSEDQSSGAEDDNAAAAREHYVAVGKSKLRKPEKPSLGREYAGSRVSRGALECDDGEDDPFRKASSEDDSDEISEELDELENGLETGEDGSDGENDSDEALGENHVDHFKDATSRCSKTTKHLDLGTHSDDLSNELGSEEELDGRTDPEEDGEFRGFDEGEEEDSDEDDSGSDNSEDGDVYDDDREPIVPTDDRAEIRRLMASDHKTVAVSLSHAAKADAAKGSAIKRQRLTFEAMLNSRIKLQRGITALNSLAPSNEHDNATDQASIKAAEAAALTLWRTIEDLRHTLADAQTHNATFSTKRKRGPPPTPSTSSADIWNCMEELEAEARPHRRAVLDKWALKTRGSRATLPNARGKLLNHGAADQQTITAVLDAHVAAEIESRQSKRAMTENSGQSQTNGSSDPHTSNEIYHDTMFYQTLLRDLVEERMSATNNGVEDLQIELPTRLNIHPTTGMRKDKVKRVVDTKASKGRKMRYTVHEKLQNFMAPEYRGSWGDQAREEFFASLLGRNAQEILGDDDDEDKVMEDEDDHLEENGLKLFRN